MPLVQWCLDPALMASLSDEELCQRLGSQGRTIAQRKRLIGVKRTKRRARSAVGLADRWSLKVRTWSNCSRKSVKEWESTQEQIEEVCQKFKEYSCLSSIPGFGPTLSAMVLGAIGNPWRFQNGAQVLKMVGLDLSASSSGKSQGSPVVAKKGKAEIRYALYQAAIVASTRDKHFVAYFTDQLRGREKETGIKTKKRVKLAAKMLMIAWTLMKKQECFDPISRRRSMIAAPAAPRPNGGILKVQPGGVVRYRASMEAVFKART